MTEFEWVNEMTAEKKGRDAKKMLKIVLIILGVIVLLAGMLVLYVLRIRDESKDRIFMDENLTVTSTAFEDGGMMPVEYTGRGKDISPDLCLSALSPDAKTVAVVMDDLDHPIGTYNHWVIWNLPAQQLIPQAIPHGERLDELGGAVQGVAYGKHCYRGPLPPKGMGTHSYKFNVYVLDTSLTLDARSTKKQLLAAMEGHILQYGSVTGRFKS